MEQKVREISSGLSFPSVLFFIFLVLKLTKVIDWSWWWVTSPLWISAGIGILLILAYAGIILYYYLRHGK